MKINEFTQLDELTMPGSLANKIKKGFLNFLKKNKVNKGGATPEMFQQYLGQVGIKSPSVDRELEPMGRGFTNPGNANKQEPEATADNDTDQNTKTTTSNANTTSNFKDGGNKKASDLNTYFQKFNSALKSAGDRNSKINLAKEIVNLVLDRPETGPDRTAAKSLIKKTNDLDQATKAKALRAISTGKRMESFMQQFVSVIAEHDITLEDLGVQLTEDTVSEAQLTMGKLDQLVKMAASDAKDNKTAPEKQATNMTGAFVSNFKRGMKGQVLPGRGIKGIGDKLSKAASDYDKEAGIDGSGDEENNNPTLTRGGLNAMKQDLGLENPSMAVRAIQKLMNGQALSNKNEIEAVKPLISAVNGALMDQQGRARLKQLFKFTNK